MKPFRALIAGVLAALLLLPAAACAATARTQVVEEPSGLRAVVTFTGAPGEANRVTVTEDRSQGGMVFRDRANRVRVRGECVSVDRHTARCPSREASAEVRLGDRGDRLEVIVGSFVVDGGAGDDVLVGGPIVDRLFGGRGDDVLRGGPDDDELDGGFGRDRVYGGRGDDDFVEAETEGRAARDLFDGGPSRATRFGGTDRGDQLTYAIRRRDLRIDLGRGTTSTEDRIVGFESLLGGRGDDRLSGDGDENSLEGGPGDDVLRGRGGDDGVRGGTGDDRLQGDRGEDGVTGDAGRDRLAGGQGDDFLLAAETTPTGAAGRFEPDALDCGDGRDEASTDSEDTLASDCDTVVAAALLLEVFPAIDAESADFRASCRDDDGCRGTIGLRGTEGEDFGRADFDVPRGGRTVVVSVPLTAGASAALEAGALVRVDIVPRRVRFNAQPGGYRAFMRRG